MESCLKSREVSTVHGEQHGVSPDHAMTPTPMTTPEDSTRATRGGRWLYPLLLAMQTLGALLFYWQGLPLYRQVSADPSTYEPQLETRIWTLSGIALIQVGYWIRYQVRPVLPYNSNAVLGHVVLFWSRMSFTLATSIFSLVFIAKKLNLQLSLSGYILTTVGLFSLFCYMQEMQRLGNAILEHHVARIARPAQPRPKLGSPMSTERSGRGF